MPVTSMDPRRSGVRFAQNDQRRLYARLANWPSAGPKERAIVAGHRHTTGACRAPNQPKREYSVAREMPSSLATAALLPVSYTHLRAHETKANLVCRLL